MAVLVADESVQLMVEASRFALAAVFLLAGLAKLARRREFELAVTNYGLLPPVGARFVGRWLPTGEIGAAVLLFLGVAIVPVTALLAILLACFIVAVAVNLLHGKEMDCGCFGSSGAPRRMTWWVVARNALLLGMALLILVSPPAALALWPGWGAPGSGDITSSEAAAMLFTGSAAVLTALAAHEVWRVQRVATSLQKAPQ